MLVGFTLGLLKQDVLSTNNKAGVSVQGSTLIAAKAEQRLYPSDWNGSCSLPTCVKRMGCVEKGPRRGAVIGLQSAIERWAKRSQNATLRDPAPAIVFWQFDAQRFDLAEERAGMDAQSAGGCLTVSTVSSDCLCDLHLFQGF
jgi:hypothetical protein